MSTSAQQVRMVKKNPYLAKYLDDPKKSKKKKRKSKKKKEMKVKYAANPNSDQQQDPDDIIGLLEKENPDLLDGFHRIERKGNKKRKRDREIEETSKKQKTAEELIKNEEQKKPDHEQTVYRDKYGRKLDGLTQLMNPEAQNKDEQNMEWGVGLVQKTNKISKEEEEKKLAALPFARSIEDNDLNDMLKDTLRWDDPMRNHTSDDSNVKKSKKTKKNKKEKSNKSEKSEKMSKKDKKREKEEKKRKKNGFGTSKKFVGPWPANRFNIPPGYRWDSVDRSNGYEKTYFRQQSERKTSVDAAYKWSTEDM